MDHGERLHKKYSSSRAHRVRACPGYVNFVRGFPRRTSAAAEEGTRTHELLNLHLLGINVKPDCTKDQWRSIDTVCDFLESVAIRQAGGNLVMTVEEEVTFPQSVVPVDEAGGIADILLIDEREDEAWSIDLKDGHVYVSERRNAQLLFNACAKWWNRPLRALHLVIIQPNSHMGDAVRVDTVSGVEMAEFQLSFEAAIRAAEVPGAPLVPGTHCRFCEAELTCPARERQAVSVVDQHATTIQHIDGLNLPDPALLPLDKLAYIRANADALRQWLAAADKEALRRAIEGQHIPDAKLVEAQARRTFGADVWKVCCDLSALTGGAIPPSDFMDADVVGVTKAEKMLTDWASENAASGSKRGAVRAIRDRLAFLTPRVSSGNLVLAPLSDPRPARDNRVVTGFAGIALPPPPK